MRSARLFIRCHGELPAHFGELKFTPRSGTGRDLGLILHSLLEIVGMIVRARPSGIGAVPTARIV
eukprot:8784319-Lingulodinium_polyedra.AAC.1